jgi:apolipoprotein N-acyltransferase
MYFLPFGDKVVSMRSLGVYLLFVVAGLSFAAASFFGELWSGAFFALLFAALFSIALQLSMRPLVGAYLSGICFSAAAFYWLTDTIVFFGGFPRAAALGFFVLFVLTSALQFVFAAWLHLRLSRLRGFVIELSLPLSWFAAECLFPRMFPWSLAHPLAGVRVISGTAEYFGVVPLSAWLMLCGVSLSMLLQKGLARRLIVSASSAVFLSALLLILGLWREATVSQELDDAQKVKVALIQGNVSAKEKGDVHLFNVNIETYRKLSRHAEERGAELIIWPESVLNNWIAENLDNLRNTTLDPLPHGRTPLLFGALAFREKSEREMKELVSRYPELLRDKVRYEGLAYHKYNAAFGLDPEGNLSGRYYKRVLMPFGEYIPFADHFLWLRELSPQTGDFSAGDTGEPIKLVVSKSAASVDIRAGMLICYEDLVPALSRDAVSAGANLLVNLTNDAWYGDTHAPYQHHLLALWRAIETRRYLLRATNTGLTAVVDPFGNSHGNVPLFTEDILLEEVKLLDSETVYTKIGDMPHVALSWLVVFLALSARWLVRGNTMC